MREDITMKKDNIIPKFRNEDEEREFWAIHSPLDYFNIKDFKRASFPNLNHRSSRFQFDSQKICLRNSRPLQIKGMYRTKAWQKYFLPDRFLLSVGRLNYFQKKGGRRSLPNISMNNVNFIK